MVTKSHSLKLMHKSKVLFSVIRKPAQGAETILEPANELIHYLENSLGQEIPQFDNNRSVTFLLFIDYCSDLEREEFIINTDEHGIELRARTVQGMFHAVYYFLENALGIRWLWPGKDGEIIPRHDTLYFLYGTIREKPDFDWRAIQTGGAFHGDYNGLDFNTVLHGVLRLPLAYKKDFDIWLRRNRFGGLKIADGHRWSEIAPPEILGEKHPEYYALVDGKRDVEIHDGKHGNQPCLSNRDVIDRLTEYAHARFESESDLDAFSIALNDGGNSCECDECRWIDEKANAVDVATVEHFDQITQESDALQHKRFSITDRLFWNVNEVAKKVAKRFPGKMLLTQLYSLYRRPPVMYHLPENIIAQYCVMGNMFWNEEIQKAEINRINDLSKFVSKLGIYEYYSNGSWPEIHRLFPQLIENSIRDYYNAGARYFATQPSHGFAVNGLNLYVLGRILWNRNAKSNDMVDDYCRTGFGGASSTMKKYFTAFADRWKETKSGTDIPHTPEERLAYTFLYDEDFLKARQKDLNIAHIEAKGDRLIIKRINFIQKGLDYTSLYCDALRSTLLLYQKSSVDNLQDLKESNIDMKKALQALNSWKKYWNFVKINSGKYIFDDFWVNYRSGTFGINDQTIKFLQEKTKIYQQHDIPRQKNNGLIYVETKYSPYVRGKEIGNHFKNIINEGFSFFCSKKLPDKQEKIIKNAYEYTSTIFPEMIREIKGIASALGLTAMDIFRYNSFNAIRNFTQSCDTVAVADGNGRMFLGANLDVDLEGKQRKNYFIHRLKTRKNEIIMVQWAGTLWPFAGLNSYGLACSATSAPKLPNQLYAGLPQHLALYPILLYCKDVPSAITLLSQINFIGKGLNIGLIDKSGNVAMVEKSSIYQGVSQGKRTTMFRTNHFLTEELKNLCTGDEEENTGTRYKRLNMIFNKEASLHSYDTLRNALKTHGKGGLCQHNVDGLDTQISTIANPEEGWIDICGWKPCIEKYTRYSVDMKSVVSYSGISRETTIPH